jgi:hypothetical protein
MIFLLAALLATPRPGRPGPHVIDDMNGAPSNCAADPARRYAVAGEINQALPRNEFLFHTLFWDWDYGEDTEMYAVVRLKPGHAFKSTGWFDAVCVKDKPLPVRKARMDSGFVKRLWVYEEK